MLRITTGKAKNRKIKTPKIKGYRGVQEISKMSLFAILGEKIQGAICLDLFAGSGNLGLEALSRGAKWCDFVDEHPAAVAVINENLAKCGFIDNFEVIRQDAVKFAANALRDYDIIFADPFYKDTSHRFLVQNMEMITKDNGLICFFHGENLDMENLIEGTNLKIIDNRKFGSSIFTILKKAG